MRSPKRAGRPWAAALLLGVLACAGSLACSDDQASRDRRPVETNGGSGSAPLSAIPGRAVGAAERCDLVASTGGSDRNPGNTDSPYRSVQVLVDSLADGQRGCLREGTFASEPLIAVTTPGITLTSYPGERATLKSQLKIQPGADRVTISRLNLDGRGSADLGPMVFAADTTFDNVDATNRHTGICFILGSDDPNGGRAVRTLIQNSRIHDCGVLPSDNQDHGIYVANADDVVIRGNWIHDNTDRGIQLYPDSQGTQVYGNVIYRNGEGVIISGDGEDASSDNLVRNNVIAGSRIRWNVESDWSGGLVGSGNVVEDNCVFAANAAPPYDRNGGILPAGRGFSASGNVNANPRFADASVADLRLGRSSRCLSLLER